MADPREVVRRYRTDLIPYHSGYRLMAAEPIEALEQLLAIQDGLLRYADALDDGLQDQTPSVVAATIRAFFRSEPSTKEH